MASPLAVVAVAVMALAVARMPTAGAAAGAAGHEALQPDAERPASIRGGRRLAQVLMTVPPIGSLDPLQGTVLGLADPASFKVRSTARTESKA
jgi:hypothetical protein